MANVRSTLKKRKIEEAFPDAWNQAPRAPANPAAELALPIRSGPGQAGPAASESSLPILEVSGPGEDNVDTRCRSCGYIPDLYEKTIGGSGICTSCGQDLETCKHFRSLADNLKITNETLFETSNELETARTCIKDLREKLGQTESIVTSRDAEIRMLKIELESAKAEVGLGADIDNLLGGGDLFFQLRMYFNNRWLGREFTIPVRNTYDKLRKKTEDLFAGKISSTGLTMTNFLGFNVEICDGSTSWYIMVTDPLTYSAWYKELVRNECGPSVHKVQAHFETDDPRFESLFVHEVDHPSSSKILGEEDDEHFSEGRLNEDDDDEGGYWEEDEQFSGSAAGTDEEEDEEDEYDDGEGGNEGF
jgi:hypothetical protein